MEFTDKSSFKFLITATTELIITKLATAGRQAKNVENWDKFSFTL